MIPSINPDRMAAIAASVPQSVLHSAVAAPVALPVPASPSSLVRLRMAATDNAHQPINVNHLLHAARAESQENGSTCYPTLAAELQVLVMDLARELNRLRGHGHKAQRGASLIRLSLGDSEALVEYEYIPGRAGRTWGPPEDCYEEEPEELTILGALVNGAWVDTDQFADSVLEGWEQAIRDDIKDRADADREALSELRMEALRG